MLTVLSGVVGWGLVMVAVFWSLKGRRLLPSDDHVRVVAMLWPILLPLAAVYLLYRACRFGAREVVVNTAVSIKRVVDMERHGRLLTVKSSTGNDLRPPDEHDLAAEKEVNNLLQENL